MTAASRFPARRRLVLAGLGGAVAVAGYLAAVWTTTGQSLENAALRGADQERSVDVRTASHALGQISVWSLGGAVVNF